MPKPSFKDPFAIEHYDEKHKFKMFASQSKYATAKSQKIQQAKAKAAVNRKRRQSRAKPVHKGKKQRKKSKVRKLKLKKLHRSARKGRGLRVPTRYDTPLGEMGEIGDDLVMQVRYGYAIRYLIDPTLEKRINSSFNRYVADPLMKDLIQKIDTYVPTDSGDLRRALKKALKFPKSLPMRNIGQGFVVRLNTKGIKYGKVVNRMPADWLIHEGTHRAKGRRIFSRRTGRKLNDPYAKKGWYNLLLLTGRSKGRLYLKNWLNGDFRTIIRPTLKMMISNKLIPKGKLHLITHQPHIIYKRFN